MKFIQEIEAGKMPFWQSYRTEYLMAVKKIFPPSMGREHHWLTDLYTINVFLKFSFRGHEIYDFYQDFDQACKEVQRIYPHFAPSQINPMPKNQKEHLKLYTHNAELSTDKEGFNYQSVLT